MEEPETPDAHERAEDQEDSAGLERAGGPPEEDDRPELLALILLRDQVQKLRIAEGNRAGSTGSDEERSATHTRYAAQLLSIEEEITESVGAEVRLHPAWPWLKQIHGVAETSAGLVLGHIDITRCNTVSALWRYAGYGVVDGKRERPTKGEKLHYNARLKTMVWRLIGLQVRLNGPYAVEYRNAKHTYMTTKGPEGRKEWTLGHCELAARRKAAKLFLSHLWLVWREAEGLPTRSPWIAEHDPSGQHTMSDPWKYVGGVEE